MAIDSADLPEAVGPIIARMGGVSGIVQNCQSGNDCHSCRKGQTSGKSLCFASIGTALAYAHGAAAPSRHGLCSTFFGGI
ncbi:MAG TPA: hypothetical protein VLI90_02395 [Tepidisphaeraceae bacterium]|nr:hypothetical protein [Tepidisphaeraceae bacterium]